CWCLQFRRWNGCLVAMNQSRVYAAQARDRTVANRIGLQLLRKACRTQSDLAFLEFCWQRRLYKLSISKLFFGVKDHSDTLHSTFCTKQPMTQQSRGQSGQSIWRMGNGVPLTWMHIGTPLWKAGHYPSLFVFPMAQSHHRVLSSLARTQTARTAKLSRKAAPMSFTGRSS